jgi:hypothetical protein
MRANETNPVRVDGFQIDWHSVRNPVAFDTCRLPLRRRDDKKRFSIQENANASFTRANRRPNRERSQGTTHRSKLHPTTQIVSMVHKYTPSWFAKSKKLFGLEQQKRILT